ncbi:MAG: hypothetical protein L3J87_02405, partial [Thermoplasmata archaeon]|nr:hypothetical protein [Thermoplasmata archaeon]
MTENTSSSSIDTAERTRPLSDLDRLLESVRGRVFNALGLHPWTFVEFDDGTPVLRAARADISDT